MFRRRRRHGASARRVRKPGHWKAVWGTPLRWLGTLLVLLGLAFGVHWGSQKLQDPGLFPLRHVRLKGELRNLSEAEVQQVVAAYLGQNFFVLDIDALHAAFAAKPWIEQVTVRRQWPDVLKVRFRERTAFAYWGQEEMVDINGQRFRPDVIRQIRSWPHLLGPDGREMDLIQAWREASALLDRTGLKLVRLVQDQRRAWWMTFDNGVELSLGRHQFAERLQRFVDIYPQILSGRSDEIAMVDLRYTNGFAVRWRKVRVANVTGRSG